MEKENKATLETERKKLEEDKNAFEKEMQAIAAERKKFEDESIKKLDTERKATESMRQRLKPNVSETQINIDLNKPVMARMKSRVKEIEKMSKAIHQSVMRGNIRHWITTRPKIHISRLIGAIKNDIGSISYYVYKKTSEGDKVLNVHTGKAKQKDGSYDEVELSANYILEKYVVETIQFRKPLKMEEFKEDGIIEAEQNK